MGNDNTLRHLMVFFSAKCLKSCLCCWQLFWPRRNLIDPGWNCLGLASKLSKASRKLHIPRQSWLPKKLKNPYFEYGFVRVNYGLITGWVRVANNWVFFQIMGFYGIITGCWWDNYGVPSFSDCFFQWSYKFPKKDENLSRIGPYPNISDSEAMEF